MKKKLKDKDTGSIEMLINTIKMFWTSDISRDNLKNHSDSMPKTIQKVLAVKGDATN
jgi:muramidase (phage lysozyme)